MVICGWVQNRILAYLSGEIGGARGGFIRQHIAGCKHCQKAIEMLKRAQQAVNAALSFPVTAPESLTARVMSAVGDLAPEPPDRRSRPKRRE
jgi:anti-sigma factor RsiW